MWLGITGIRFFGKRSVVGQAIEAMRRWLGELEDELTRIIQHSVVLSASRPKNCTQV